LFISEHLSVRQRLGELHCGVTVIVGANDHPFVDQSSELVSLMKGSRLVVIDGAYHSPQLTHPEEWRKAVEDHLATNV
jgi:pimeloyl-ACP methyl ester carboxylesterase